MGSFPGKTLGARDRRDVLEEVARPKNGGQASDEQRNPKTPGFPGRDVPHLRRSAFYLLSTQRLRAGLTYAALPALQKRESRLEALRNSGQAGGTQEGRKGCITRARRICPLLKEVASGE
jgi:hypothetical protein